MSRNNKFTLAMLAVGLASVVSAVNAIINAYFGIQYFFCVTVSGICNLHAIVNQIR